MTARFMLTATLLALFTPATIRSSAIASPPANAPTGLLVMAHGGTPDWNAAVEQAVASLRAEGPVAVAFGMADPVTLRSAVSTLEAAGAGSIAVVRLFVSGDSFRHQTEYLLGLRADPPARFLLHAHPEPGTGADHATHGGHRGDGEPRGHGGHGGHGSESATHTTGAGDTAAAAANPSPIPVAVPIALSDGGLDQYPGAVTILAERVRALSRSPEHEALLVLSHGFEDEAENERARTRIQALAIEAARPGGFAEIRAETLREDWPEARRAAERRIRAFVEAHGRAGRRTLVVPFRVFGFGPYGDVLEGLEYVSDGRGLLPHPAITEWIRTQGRGVAARQGWKAAAPAAVSREAGASGH